MNFKKFDKLLAWRLLRTKEVLASKNAEYSDGVDKLHNFKVAGRKRNKSPEEALMGMFIKHMVSIDDVVDKIEREFQITGFHPIKKIKRFITKKLLEEKIGDAINYLILLEALIKERYGYE